MGSGSRSCRSSTRDREAVLVGVRRWWSAFTFVIAVAALTAVVAVAATGGPPALAPPGGEPAGGQGAAAEAAEPEGGDDYLALQRRGGGDVERKYQRALEQSRAVAEAAPPTPLANAT